MTDDELDAIERDWRGFTEQREDFCSMCGKGWDLWKVTDEGEYRLHHHIPPWDYDYGEENNWPDPREDIRALIEEVRRLKEELAKDGL